MTARTNQPDSPLLQPDQCRVTHPIVSGGRTNAARDPATQHCCAPVVNKLWQLCERHNADRLRMITADRVRVALHG